MRTDAFKLHTQSISLLDQLLPQKCFIPKCVFPYEDRWQPGTWSKCLLENDSFAICRVYPRTDVQCCYLDNSVASKSFDTGVLKLSQMVHLDAVTVSEVSLIFTLKQKILRQKDLTPMKLLNMAKYLLQSLMLVADCIVLNKDLSDLGIENIQVQAKDCGEFNCFMITEQTVLHLYDVRIVEDKAVNAHFIPYGFEQPLKDLNDLLCTVGNPNRPKGVSLNVLLTGATGTGKSALLQEFVRSTACNCFTITAAKVLGQYAGDAESELRQIFESANCFSKRLKSRSPTIILLKDLHLLCPAVKLGASDSGNALRISSQLLTLIDETGTDNPQMIIIATTSAPETLNEPVRRAGRFEREITLGIPTEEVRRQLFAALFTVQFPTLKVDDHLLSKVAAQTQGFVIADIALLIRTIGQALLIKPTADLSKVIDQALQHSQPSAVRNTDVSVLKSTAGFESIGGMTSLKRTLSVAVLAGLEHKAAFARFGLQLPKGVLLYGPPGCAKTTISKCLAKEANMTFIATSAAEVYSPYVGCAEKFITKIFDTARRNAPCLIFLDEIDSLVGRRSISNSGAGGDVQLRILSTLLTEMDGIVTAADILHHILVVAATNRPDMVDDALMRPGRFDKLIHVPAPDLDSRRAVLELHAQRMPFAKNVSVNEIAKRTEHYSGADLCNLCNEAAMHAFQSDFDATVIDMADFEAVLSSQKSSLTGTQIAWYYEFAEKFVR